MVTRSASAQRDYTLRLLEVEDYGKGYASLLAQLTDVGDFPEARFVEVFNYHGQCPGAYTTIVAEHQPTCKVVATATLLVERKYVHAGASIGHVEDVVVDAAHRGRGLGQELMRALQEQASKARCYKLILACKSSTVPFHEKCGYRKCEQQMRLDVQLDFREAPGAPARAGGLPAPRPLPAARRGPAAAAGAEDYCLRLLELGDYSKGYVALLAQLTDVGDLTEQGFAEVFHCRGQFARKYTTLVVEHRPSGKVVATATLLAERKFAHAGASAGHVEDVVVDAAHRGRGLAKELVDALGEQARGSHCYKVVLDCKTSNVPLYEKCGYRTSEQQMRLDIDLEPPQAPGRAEGDEGAPAAKRPRS